MGVDAKSMIFDASGADIDAICAVARNGAAVTIGADAIAGIEAAYACLVRHAGEGKAIYGVSTGLGAAVDTRLDPTKDSGAAPHSTPPRRRRRTLCRNGRSPSYDRSALSPLLPRLFGCVG